MFTTFSERKKQQQENTIILYNINNKHIILKLVVFLFQVFNFFF